MKKTFVSLRNVFGGVRTRLSKMSARAKMLLAMFLSVATANAQEGGGGAAANADPEAGASALEGAVEYIVAYLPVIQNIVYALGAVVFMAGVYTVAHAFQNGDQDAKGKAVALIGGSIVLIIGVTVLPRMFGFSNN